MVATEELKRLMREKFLAMENADAAVHELNQAFQPFYDPKEDLKEHEPIVVSAKHFRDSRIAREKQKKAIEEWLVACKVYDSAQK